MNGGGWGKGALGTGFREKERGSKYYTEPFQYVFTGAIYRRLKTESRLIPLSPEKHFPELSKILSHLVLREEFGCAIEMFSFEIYVSL